VAAAEIVHRKPDRERVSRPLWLVPRWLKACYCRRCLATQPPRRPGKGDISLFLEARV
jgi:hypothetical protein